MCPRANEQIEKSKLEVRKGSLKQSAWTTLPESSFLPSATRSIADDRSTPTPARAPNAKRFLSQRPVPQAKSRMQRLRRLEAMAEHDAPRAQAADSENGRK